MDCIYNRKPEDRHCDYCSALCKNNPAYEYLKARTHPFNNELTMTNAELLAKIKAEIERRIAELENDKYINLDAKVCRQSELKYLDRFLDTLEEPVSVPPVCEELNEAAKAYTDARDWAKENYLTPYIRQAFIAGAKWQAEKDARDMYMSDNRHFEKVYQLGRTDMREQMLNEAVEGKIIFLLNGDVAVNIGDTDEYKLGQKVRIIIVKEDEK